MKSQQSVTAIGGAQFLAFSFGELMALLCHVPSNASRDELYLLGGHQVLKAEHLGCQSLNLGLSLLLSTG